MHLRSDQSVFDLKLHSISHSLYGVDIDPGAVEIAKLRLWLALVVEESEPHPLPNLEHKIMQGNSLISEYEGVKLFDESFLEEANHLERERVHVEARLSELQREYFALHSQDALSAVKKEELEREIRSLNKRKKALNAPNELLGQEMSIFDAPGKFQQEQEKTELLQKKIDQCVSESQRSRKQQLKEEIEQLKWRLIESSLREQDKLDHLEKLMVLRHRNIKPFFIWKLEFSDVFKDNGGFDIIVGNPPYVGEKGNKSVFDPIVNGNMKRFHQGKMDLFYFFFHLALEIGREISHHAFITTNYFITASGGRKLRQDLKQRSTIRNLVNFNEQRVFASALGQHNMITLFSKGLSLEKVAKVVSVQKAGTVSSGRIFSILKGEGVGVDVIEVPSANLYDGGESYIRMPIKTKDYAVQGILDKIQKQATLLGQIASINKGFHSGCDKVTAANLKKVDGDFTVGDGIFVLSKREALEKGVVSEPIVHKCYKNSDIGRWYARPNDWKGLYVIYTNKHTTFSEAPASFSHLKKFRPFLEIKREYKNGLLPWFSQHWARDEDIFTRKNKIVLPYRTRKNTFALSDTDYYSSEDVLYIDVFREEIDSKFVLGLLNSKMYFLWLYHRGKRKGEALELYTKPLSEIPILDATPSQRLEIVEIVERLIEVAKREPQLSDASQNDELEARLNDTICRMFGLSDEEKEYLTNLK